MHIWKIVALMLLGVFIVQCDRVVDSHADVQKVGIQAYIYGYPLVLMDVTKKVMTHVSEPDKAGHAPLNQFSHRETFPDDTFKDVVRPNLDTLYSSAWLDLSKGPVVLSLPASDRFYMLQMMDAWSNVFASPGTRTTGTKAGDYLITGPEWDGIVPTEMVEIKSPTNVVWILGRTQTNGKADYTNVHKQQAEYKLIPFDREAPLQKPLAPINLTAPAEQVASMDAKTFFTYLTHLLAANSENSLDQAMIGKMADIGLIPSTNFNYDALSPMVQKELENVPQLALQEIESASIKNVPLRNQWLIKLKNVGTYGNDYTGRAAVAWRGLGANIPADAVYPYTRLDADGKPLSGSQKYMLHFSKNQIPPVKAFWSLTAYNKDQFLIKNPLNRFAIGDRDPLKFNSDGSLDLYIQKDPPGSEKENNWLPVAEGPFDLLLRLYWPKEEVLNEKWTPPALKRVP